MAAALAVQWGSSALPAKAGNARELLDAYLALAAAAAPAYRTNLRPAASADPEAAPPPDGRHFGRSPVLGPFTYRSRTYAELSREERIALWRDPGLRAFLAGLRVRAARFSVPPSELLRPGPLVVLFSQP